MSENILERNNLPIRKVIELLCKILGENGMSLIKAEVFRKAKFDENDATCYLWRLLFDTICYCNNARPHIDKNDKDLVRFVKRELIEREYTAVDLVNLNSNMEEGSRELLLAFGWFFCKEQMILKFIKHRTGMFNDSDQNLLNVFDISSERLDNHGSKPSNTDLTNNSVDPFVKVQHLLTLNNKLRLNLCSLYSLQRELYTLKHKIYEATGNHEVNGETHHNYLSVFELRLLKSPEKLKKYLDLLETDNNRLGNLLKWKETEEVFWKWMESVLDLKLSQTSCNTKASVSSDDLSHLQSVASSQLAETCQELETIIEGYDKMIDHIGKLCLDKSDKVQLDELNLIVTMIEEEIGKHKAILNWENNSNQSPAFVLTKLKPIVHKTTKEKNTEQDDVLKLLKETRNSLNNRDCDIKYQTKQLKVMVKQLEADLARQKDKLKVELSELSSKLDDCYLIPPLKNVPNK